MLLWKVSCFSESLRQQQRQLLASQIGFYTSAFFHWRCISFSQRKTHSPWSSLPFSSTNRPRGTCTCFESLLTLLCWPAGGFLSFIKEKHGVGQPFYQHCKVLETTVQRAVSCTIPSHPSELFSLIQGCYSPNFSVPLLAQPDIALICIVCFPAQSIDLFSIVKSCTCTKCPITHEGTS